MDATATLLTADEAALLAEDLLGRSADKAQDSTINMASACVTSEGGVVITLLGVVERHDSLASFLRAYAISHR